MKTSLGDREKSYLVRIILVDSVRRTPAGCCVIQREISEIHNATSGLCVCCALTK